MPQSKFCVQCGAPIWQEESKAEDFTDGTIRFVPDVQRVKSMPERQARAAADGAAVGGGVSGRGAAAGGAAGGGAAKSADEAAGKADMPVEVFLRDGADVVVDIDASAVVGQTLLSTWKHMPAEDNVGSAVQPLQDVRQAQAGQQRESFSAQQVQPFSTQQQGFSVQPMPYAPQQPPTTRPSATAAAQPIPNDPRQSQSAPWQPRPASPQPQPAPWQSQPVSPQSGYAQPVHSGASKRKAPIVLVIVGVILGLALLAFVILYVVPLFVPHEGGPTKTLDGDTAATVEHESAKDPDSSDDGAASQKDISAVDIVTAVLKDDSSKDHDAAPSKEADSSSGGASSSGSADSSDEAVLTSSDDDPVSARLSRRDFAWYTDDMASGIVPAGVQMLTSLGDVTGTWKAYLVSDPSNERNARSERSLAVSINVGQSAVMLDFDWDYIYIPSENKGYEEDASDSIFRGSWEDGVLDAVGSGSVRLTAFWSQDGHQYGIGTMMWTDGVPATIALVRDA